MTNILVIWQGWLAGAVARSAGKITKNIPEFFEIGKYYVENKNRYFNKIARRLLLAVALAYLRV